MRLPAESWFLIVAAVAITWLACRWWYGRRLRSLQRQLARALARADAPSEQGRREPIIDSAAGATADQPNAASDPLATPRTPVPDISDDYPSVPFLDTSPSTHEPSNPQKRTRRPR
jgi:hypothetical protein